MASSKPKTTLITRDMIANRDRLSAEVESARRDLVVAEQRVEKARAEVERVESQSPEHQYSSDELRSARRALSAANNALSDAKARVRDATREFAKVAATVDAPEMLARAEAALDDATATRTSIEVALAEIVSKQAAITSRETALASKQAETDAANAALAIDDLPIDLSSAVKLEAERRAVAGALSALREQAESLSIQRDGAISRQRTARDEMRLAATTIAELELAAALRPLLPLLAKVQLMTGSDPRRVEIQVPDSVIAQVEASIADPAADR